MDRLYKQNSNTLRSFTYMLIENQLEFLVDNEFGDLNNIINNMSKSEYERFLDDIWNDFMDDTTIWEEIDNNITDKIRHRLENQ